MIWKEQFVHFANKIDYHNFRLFAKCCFMTTSNTCNIINYLNSNPTIFDLLIKWYLSIILASNKAATRRASLPSLIIPLTLCEDSRKVWLISIIFLTNLHRMCQIIWNLLLHFWYILWQCTFMRVFQWFYCTFNSSFCLIHHWNLLTDWQFPSKFGSSIL